MIDPIILKGTRDFSPTEMRKRQKVMDIMKTIFERFGYGPIETPILSPAETILGKYGEEGEKLTYMFPDNGGRMIALPYDLTVPFARYFAANYNDLPIPFKRYQMQRVWRGERPQKGRLREFYQCDIDIIGTDNLLCEAEVAKIINLVFSTLGITDFTIKCNSRKTMNAILGAFEIEEKDRLPVIRIIDKLDKIGLDSVCEELVKVGVKEAKKLMSVLQPAKTNSETLKKLREYGIEEIETFMKLIAEIGVDQSSILIDPTLARGLDYYTGLIFEVISNESDFGTICAGGRYDNLCSTFIDQSFSGMGVSFGFERIMLLIEKLNLFQDIGSASEVLVTIFDQKDTGDSLKIYSMLGSASIPCEIYLGTGNLQKQLKFANKKEIPFVVIQGPDEKGKDEVTIRRMENGIQKSIPVNQLVSYFKNYYETR